MSLCQFFDETVTSKTSHCGLNDVEVLQVRIELGKGETIGFEPFSFLILLFASAKRRIILPLYQ